MSLPRRNTEMVGSLVVSADAMSKEATTTTATTPESASKGIVHAATEAVEHFGKDLKRSCNLQKRKTEMYGTLIVDHQPPLAPNSPTTSSPSGGGGSKKRRDYWNEPLDEISAEELSDIIYGL